MLVRRCEIVVIEPVEEVKFDLQSLLAGQSGLIRELKWRALAPHLGEPIEISHSQRELLGRISPSTWMDAAAFHGEEGVLNELIDSGLIISSLSEGGNARDNDARLRGAYWHPIAAILHAFTRWSDVDTVKNMQESGTDTAIGMREVLGVPPPEVLANSSSLSSVDLLWPAETEFDELISRRVTCRNFDAERTLSFSLFSQIMARVFAARAELRVGADLAFLKKSVPSGGGLHPMDAYLIIQNVEGLSPGLYFYRADKHAVEFLGQGALPLREFAMTALAQQHWFADAHVMVVLVPRFNRTFWKYRQHAKGYRVVAMEAGHLSQMLYLAATEAGLGAFVTGGINERQLEAALGIDPITQGALAICGFGWRANQMKTAELDPNGVIWSE